MGIQESDKIRQQQMKQMFLSRAFCPCPEKAMNNTDVAALCYIVRKTNKQTKQNKTITTTDQVLRATNLSLVAAYRAYYQSFAS